MAEAVNAVREEIGQKQAAQAQGISASREREQRRFQEALEAAARKREANDAARKREANEAAAAASKAPDKVAFEAQEPRAPGRFGRTNGPPRETTEGETLGSEVAVARHFPGSNQGAMRPFGQPSRKYTHLNPNGQGETTPPAGAFGPPGPTEPTPAARAAAASLGAATTAAVARRDSVRVRNASTGTDPDPRINALIAQVSELQARPVSDPGRLAELEAELRRLQTAAGRGRASQEALEAAQADLAKLRGQLQGAQGNIARLRSSGEATERQLMEQRAAAERQIGDLRGELERVAAAQRAAAERAATAAAAAPPAAAALQGAAQEAGQTIAVIRETAEQSQETIRRLIASHEATIRGLTAQQAALVTGIQGATNANRALTAEFTRSSDAAATRTAEAIRASAEATTRQIEFVVAGFREALVPIREALTGLPAMIASIQASGGTNDAQIAELIRQNGDLRESTGNLRGRIESLEREVGTTTERLSTELREQKAELKTEIAELRAQLAAPGKGTNTTQILETLKEVMKTHTDGLKDVIAALKPGAVSVTGSPSGMNTKAELLKELNALKARLAALEKAKANAPTTTAKNAITVQINTVKKNLETTTTEATADVKNAKNAVKNTTERCKYGWRNVDCGPGKPCNPRIKCGSRSGGRRRTQRRNKRKQKTQKTQKRQKRQSRGRR